MSRCPRLLFALQAGVGAASRPFSTAPGSSSTPQQNAQIAVAAAAAAGVGYLLMASGRQSDQEKHEKDLEIERGARGLSRCTEKKLSARLAAELVNAEAHQSNMDWKATLERVVPAIVSLKLNSPKVGSMILLTLLLLSKTDARFGLHYCVSVQ
ncbi:hypothetical protein BBJ28_00009047 [Nothophytophthora sp. Chile5]|nr:hypothetical protein BBJ28_00009047 [Nothophytophthora sp. Chile5]